MASRNLIRLIPERWEDEKDHRFKMAQVINGLLRGKANNTSEVTLKANATTTEIIDSRISTDTFAVLVPKTLTAASAHSALFQTSTKGKITLTHDSDAAINRLFGVLLQG